MDKIKTIEKCPFCGHDVVEVVGNDGLSYFKCLNRECLAVTTFSNEVASNCPDRTYEYWNRRCWIG